MQIAVIVSDYRTSFFSSLRMSCLEEKDPKEEPISKFILISRNVTGLLVEHQFLLFLLELEAIGQEYLQVIREV